MIARTAGAQHGRITTSQLAEAGATAAQVKRWVREGWLRREHLGVYAVGHGAPSFFGELVSAVLAAGDGAAASHASAAHASSIVRGAAPPPEVTVPTTSGRRRPGITIHRVRRLPALDVTDVAGMRMATVPRTLLDLAPLLSPPDLVRACHEAWVRHRTGAGQIEACIARNPDKPGAAKLRRALGTDVTLSALEDGFLALLNRHGLPPPRTNVDRAGDKVDCHWPDRDLTIELLSYRFHASRQAFETDVARRRRSRHVAFTYGDVFERGAATAAEVRRVLYPTGA